MEAEALEATRGHLHWIKHFASIELGDTYYFVFEWADGGSLRQSWTKDPDPQEDVAPLVEEIIVQYRQLADALNAFQSNASQSPIYSSPATDLDQPSTASNPSVMVNDNADTSDIDGLEDNTSQNWRHGDLKPDNILIFLDKSKRLGTLKIADLGLAKCHYEKTSLRKKNTDQKLGTTKYEAPEAPGQAPRSRRYDIWSMGCIILDNIVWLLYGKAGLKSFYDKEPQDPWQKNATLYYKAIHGNLMVNDITSNLIKDIFANNPSFDQVGGSAIGDLLRLVRDKLLVVELPHDDNGQTPKGSRINAKELHIELQTILDNSARRGYMSNGYVKDTTLSIPDACKPTSIKTQSLPVLLRPGMVQQGQNTPTVRPVSNGSTYVEQQILGGFPHNQGVIFSCLCSFLDNFS